MERKRERGRERERNSPDCADHVCGNRSLRRLDRDKGNRGRVGTVEEEKAEMRPQLRRYHRGAAHLGSGGLSASVKGSTVRGR